MYSYLCRVMYNRRNQMNPLWNSLVVGGVQPGADGAAPSGFLGSVAMIGTHYTDRYDSHQHAGQLVCCDGLPAAS